MDTNPVVIQELAPIELKTASDPNLAVMLKPPQMQIAQQRAGDIDVSSSVAMTDHGASALAVMNQINADVLKQVNANEAGVAGEMLVDLKSKLGTFDATKLVGANSREGKILTPILDFIQIFPGGVWVAGKISAVRRLRQMYQPLEKHIGDLTDSFNSRLVQQKGWLIRYDKLIEAYSNAVDQLEIDIKSGEIRLGMLRDEYERRRLELQGSNDIRAIAELSSFGTLIRKFDEHLYNLQLARFNAVRMLPTTMISKAGAEGVLAIVQRTITFVLPEFRNQLVLAIGLESQREALSGTAEVEAIYERAMMANVALAGENQRMIKRMEGDGFVKAEKLVEATNALMTIINEGITMDDENQKKRAENTKLLKTTEASFKQAMIAAGTRAAGLQPATA